jgi:hypothetical protein
LVTNGFAAGRPMLGDGAAGRAGGDAGWVVAPPAATARAAAASAAPTGGAPEPGGRGDVDEAPLVRPVDDPDVAGDDGVAGLVRVVASAAGAGVAAGAGFTGVVVRVGASTGFAGLATGADEADGDEPEPDDPLDEGSPAGAAGDEPAADPAEPVPPLEPEPDEPGGCGFAASTVEFDEDDDVTDGLPVVTAVPADVPGRSDPASGRGLSADELTHHLRGRTSGHGMSSGTLLVVAPDGAWMGIPLVGRHGIPRVSTVRCRRRRVA